MSVQDCSEEISLHLEDGEFMEECQEDNSSVKVSPLSTEKKSKEPVDNLLSQNKKLQVCSVYNQKRSIKSGLIILSLSKRHNI